MFQWRQWIAEKALRRIFRKIHNKYFIYFPRPHTFFCFAIYRKDGVLFRNLLPLDLHFIATNDLLLTDLFQFFVPLLLGDCLSNDFYLRQKRLIKEILENISAAKWGFFWYFFLSKNKQTRFCALKTRLYMKKLLSNFNFDRKKGETRMKEVSFPKFQRLFLYTI